MLARQASRVPGISFQFSCVQYLSARLGKRSGMFNETVRSFFNQVQHFHSELPIAKNQNTYAKRQREQEKKQRADDKRKKRDKKKDGSYEPAPPRSYAFPSEDPED